MTARWSNSSDSDGRNGTMANMPSPELMLSPITRNLYHEFAPPLSESAGTLLRMLDQEEWCKPNATVEQRRMAWDRDDPANFVLGNGTLLSPTARTIQDPVLQAHIRQAYNDPVNPVLRKKNLTADTLEFSTFSLSYNGDLDSTPDGKTEGRSADDMVASPEAFLDEPARIAPMFPMGPLALREEAPDVVVDEVGVFDV